MAESTQTQLLENVPSPFCGIASDDLKIEVAGQAVKVIENGDAVTLPGFERPITDTSPRIGGEPARLEQAIARAAELLKSARLPVFSGFGTDVNETRAALSLIDRSRGVFDQARAEGGLRNLLVLADSGWMATTLGELKNRVDVLVSFGTDIEANFPRFFERFIWTPETLFDTDTAKREVIYIGRAPSGTAANAPDGRVPQVIPCAQENLPQVAAALAALASGANLQAEDVGGVPLAELRAVVDRLKQASYGVVTWAAGQLNFPHAELTVQQLCKMVIALNRDTRCSALPLGGQDGDRTASQVAAWISGYPTRVSYARGYPEYDPYHNGAARLLAEGEADALVWVSSLSLNPPPVSAVPTVVIGRSGMTFEKEPDVFIPVGVPGIDFAGHMYRCDNVVAMPLYKLRESGLARAAEVLAGIEARLAEST
ncbi:formylmethanofuran dehydrogenase subunit B [Methylomagnum sp.]